MGIVVSVVFVGLWPFYVSVTPYDVGLFSVRIMTCSPSTHWPLKVPVVVSFVMHIVTNSDVTMFAYL